MRFRERAIRDLKSKAAGYEKYDDGGRGFGIRIYPSGQKTWISRYKWNGSTRKPKHGDFIKPVRDGDKTDAPGMSLAEARGKHAALRELIRQGIDPREANDLKAEQARIEHEQKLEALREEQASDTINHLADRYIKRWAKENHKTSWREEERMLDKDVTPAWGDRKAKDITRRDVLALMDDIKARLRFLLVTGQRRGELVGASWDEFDLDGGWWTIPGSRTKNSRTHRVPLSPMAMDLIKELKELSGKSPWVLPSTRGEDKIHMNAQAVSHVVSKNRDIFEVDPWCVHDLRRTAISYMRSINAVREFVPKVVNHSEPGITSQVYDLYTYDPEKRRTLNAWSRKLKKILEDKKEDKVVQFPGKAAG